MRQIDDTRTGLRPGTAKRRFRASRRAHRRWHHERRELHVPGRLALSLEDGSAERDDWPGAPWNVKERGDGARARLAAPGRTEWFRRSLPSSALRRHA